MSRARDNANLGTQAGSGLDASDITSGALGASVTGGAGLAVSTATTTALNDKAPLANPDFTGVVDAAGPITFAGTGQSAQSQGALAYSSGSGQVTMLAYGPDSTTKGFFQFQTLESDGGDGTNHLTIQADGDVGVNTENLVIGTAGKGVMFHPHDEAVTGPPGSDSNLLDDYEEGTWTPVVNGMTLTPNSGGHVIGHYTKIGNLVTAITSIYNVTSSGTPHFWMTGLPFTCGSYRGLMTGAITYQGFSTASPTGFVNNGDSTAPFYSNVADGAWAAANVRATGLLYMHVSYTYYVA